MPQPAKMLDAVALLRWFSLVMFAGVAHSAEVVTDASIHRQILVALFPHAKIELQRGINSTPLPKPVYSQLEFPDALASRIVYKVRGPYQDEDERCASENMSTETFSDVRDLRMMVWKWPGFNDGSHLLTLVQYHFAGAAPAGSCWSIGRLLHLRRSAAGFVTVTTERLDMTHHTGIQLARLVDLDGNGLDELIIEADWGGAGTVGSTLKVFDLQGGDFKLWLSVPSRFFESAEEIQQYVQVLDIQRTQRQNAAKFCFTKTVFAAHDRSLPTPAVTRPCYEKYEGTRNSYPAK